VGGNLPPPHNESTQSASEEKHLTGSALGSHKTKKGKKGDGERERERERERKKGLSAKELGIPLIAKEQFHDKSRDWQRLSAMCFHKGNGNGTC